MSLKQVKNKIAATKSTKQVTKAMESVSAVKMRKTQERALLSRPYIQSAARILQELIQTEAGKNHPLAQSREDGRLLLIITTSDKGLAGNLNSAVLKLAESRARAYGYDNIDTICIGRKAVEFAERLKLPVLYTYTNVRDEVSLSDVRELTQHALERFTNESYDHVEVVYQDFRSTFEQEPKLRSLLPLSYDAFGTLTAELSEKTKQPNTQSESEQLHYTVEPSAEEVLRVLIPQLLEVLVYHALVEHKASEHSARMVAMKSASDKATDMVQDLTIQYNKARQASITSEVNEITAGVEAMK